jgi:hypothetical protein
VCDNLGGLGKLEKSFSPEKPLIVFFCVHFDVPQNGACHEDQGWGVGGLVPEPSALAIAVIAAGGALRRRRRVIDGV